MTTIIKHPDFFEVSSDDGATVRQFKFDDHPGRRAISGVMKRKQALQEARAFAGKGARLVELKTKKEPRQPEG